MTATQRAASAQAPAPASPAAGGLAAGGSAEPPARLSELQDPSTAAGRLGRAFKRAMVATRKLRGRETQRLDHLSYAQYSLLFGLAGMCAPSARELADHAELSPATVTQMLEHMETAGLVRRTRSDQDRRVVLSELTEQGAAVVAERHAQMEPRWREALSEFSEDELDAAARVLDRLADFFTDLLEQGD